MSVVTGNFAGLDIEGVYAAHLAHLFSGIHILRPH